MPEYQDIAYNLVRSNRSKTASILLERDGTIKVRVPWDFPQEDVEKLLEKKRGWIYRSLAEWEAMNASRVERRYVNGAGFLYLGRTYQMRKVKIQEVPLKLKDGYFLLCLPDEKNDDAVAEKAFSKFYSEKAKEWILKRIRNYQGKVGKTPAGIRILDLKHRWASCSANGVLNFHWKCIMTPLTALDYIIVHELCHLHSPRHDEIFWNEVDKVLPDYEKRREWLRKNGAGMDL